MILTCPHCAKRIAVRITAPTYEVRTTCPRCGCAIVVEVGAPQVGPSEWKERE